MLYCCREHQIADRNSHKEACIAVKKSRRNLERAERELRAAPADFMLPDNVFETGVGMFWEIVETQDYMRARRLHVDKLVKINTYDAVKAAFDHVMDMIRLCRMDHLGLRLMSPALFIRLGKEQECYDFIKWYANTSARDYDFENIGLPFLDIKDADVFEPIRTFGPWITCEYAIALMLIKMKVLTDVRTLQNSLILYDLLPLPPELVDRIRKEAIVTKIVVRRRDIFNSSNHKPLIVTLAEQVKQLFHFVSNGYKTFWPGLLDPNDSLALPLARYNRGSDQWIQLIVQHYYQAFVETPGSIQMIKHLTEIERS